ncbi:MAG: VCBS repeat-containing protein [Planctomycetes bacterium]|nr:VCBS repeat-containing protein [Planctomycetota bacterium]
MGCRPILLAALALGLAGCGAGVITGGVLSTRGGGGAPVEESITLSDPSGPLLMDGEQLYVRRAVLRGPRLRSDLEFELRLEWRTGGAFAQDVQNLFFSEPTATETTLTFTLVTSAIAAAAGDPTAADVDAELIVIGRSDVLAPTEMYRTPFRLLRQPTLELVPSDPGRGISVVPVSGGDIVLRVSALPTQDARDVTVEVGSNDPDPAPGRGTSVLIRRATNLRTQPGANPGEVELTCTVPPSTYPTEAFVRVLHTLAGRSTVVGGVIYEPELVAVIARRGSVAGGDLVSLSGRGLVPLDFSTSPPTLAFSRVQVTFEKGVRSQLLQPDAIRTSLSSLNNIVLATPPSPDGLPGAARVRLQVGLGFGIQIARDDLFAYAADAPDFGPRGVTLAAAPIATALGALRTPIGAGAAVDLGVLTQDGGGVPFATVYEALQNGTFTRVGVPIRAADRGTLGARWPVDLIAGDFQGDELGDLLIVAGGAGGAALHSLLVGAEDLGEPLSRMGIAFATGSAPAFGRRVRLEGADRDAALVFGGTDPLGSTALAMSDPLGQWAAASIWTTASPARVDAACAADADGDGAVDLLFAAGGAGAALHVCYGPASGGFVDRRSVPLDVLPDIADRRVLGSFVTPGRDVLLVTTDAVRRSSAVVTLREAAPRSLEPPVEQSLPSGFLAVATTFGDLGRDGQLELVLAGDDGELVIWQRDAGTGAFTRLPGAVPAVGFGTVRSLAIGVAVPGAAARGDALFVDHRSDEGGGPEDRVTTLLVDDGPRLTHPRGELPMRRPVRNVVLAALGGEPGEPADVVVEFDDELVVLRNDGVGRLTEVRDHALTGLVEGLSIRAPDPSGGDALVFALEDGRLGVLRPTRIAPNPLLSTNSLFPGPGTLREASRFTTADLDDDGRTDLVAVLSIARPDGSIERCVVVLAGRAPTARDPLPWAVRPTGGRPELPADATGLAVGDFAPDVPRRRLEVAVAIDSAAGTGVRFFRLDPSLPGAVGLVESFVDPDDPWLAAGVRPHELLAIDLEGDGRDDLIVVSGSRDTIHLFRRAFDSTRTTTDGIVDPRTFLQSAEAVIPAGTPLRVRLVDVDSDGIPDVVLHVQHRTTRDLHRVALFVLNGIGGFAQQIVLPEVHTGRAGEGMAIDVGDLNGDRLADLVIGWGGDALGVGSHVRHLFGTER